MDQNKLINKLKEEYDNIKINEEGIDIMKQSINKAKNERKNSKKWAGVAVAAGLGAFIVIPNVSPTVAMAMSKIPVVSEIVNIITLNKYSDSEKNVNVQLPVVQDKDNSLEQFNQTTDEYIKTLVQKFESEFNPGDNKSLDISYTVLADRDDIFSLKVIGLETSASSYQYSKVYNLDKNTGKTLELKDIFKENSNYIEVLSENIKTQMKNQMAEDESKTYFIDDKDMPEENFKQIKPDQNFYINSDGNLVILFDEYEVAPGYMGAVEFVINKNDIKEILK